jgi:hypothetical protein
MGPISMLLLPNKLTQAQLARIEADLLIISIDYDTYEPTDRWVIIFSLAIAILGAGIIYYIFTT